jgi:Putative peptidoglycan binding domain
MAILKKGLSGEPVRRLQTKLGVKADGTFGDNTEKALKNWQTKNGLAADGVAGPDTFMAMGLYELVLLAGYTRRCCQEAAGEARRWRGWELPRAFGPAEYGR